MLHINDPMGIAWMLGQDSPGGMAEDFQRGLRKGIPENLERW
jgi:hypothetical protein